MSRTGVWLVRGVLIVFAVVGFGGMITVVALVPPEGTPIYPKCFSYTVLGIHCPGCGMTRATHALLNGQLLQSLAYNLLTIPVLAYVGLVALRYALCWYQGKPLQTRTWPRWLMWLTLGLFLAYGVCRNIPTEPFTWLAPHKLTE